MRRTESARYARWAGLMALGIALLVAGLYAVHALQRAGAQRHAPPPVAPSVMQQSAEFSFSKVEQDRTIFTVKASRATQFKDADKSLLEDVAITIYGPGGKRNDSIHTRQCSYEPQTGSIRCEGAAEIELESAQKGADSRAVRIKTRDISFNRNTGEATTDAPVTFQFSDGEGSGAGLLYDSDDSVLRLRKRVEIRFQRAAGAFATPATLTGSSLEYHRQENRLRLLGPVRVVQGPRELTADRLTLSLGANLRPQNVTADGHTELRIPTPDGKQSFTASRLEALLNPFGRIERMTAEGDARGSRESAGNAEQFSAQKVEAEFDTQANQLRQLNASGAVQFRSQRQEHSQSLETPALTLHFESSSRRGPRQAETLGPATYVSRSEGEETRVHGQKLAARWDDRGRLEKVFGRSGVEIERQLGSGAPQMITAQESTVGLAPGGDWSDLKLDGRVRFRQNERTAEAQSARLVRATDVITLSGSPVVSDSFGRTAAAVIEINQRTGALQATGGIRTSFYAPGRAGDPSLGSGPAFLSADTLSGNNQSGEVTYSGHARLWQGNSVLSADAIQIWRNEQRLEARGAVMGLFVEASARPKNGAAPVLWHVAAPLLRYSSVEAHARAEGGVHATSDQGDLTSRNLDLFLSCGAAPRQVERAVASGTVAISQSGRRATADQAEYTAAEEKVVLTGGSPTLTDALGDTTTGHSLTFFLASDSIFIDSEKNMRTLTKHRIEK